MGDLPKKFSYSGYAARLLTYQEVYSGCYDGIVDITVTGGLSSRCKYLMENACFNVYSNSGIWGFILKHLIQE